MTVPADNNAIEVNITWVPEITSSGVLPSRRANRAIGSPLRRRELTCSAAARNGAVEMPFAQQQVVSGSPVE
jgi:hypothetical protein